MRIPFSKVGNISVNSCLAQNSSASRGNLHFGIPASRLSTLGAGQIQQTISMNIRVEGYLEEMLLSKLVPSADLFLGRIYFLVRASSTGKSVECHRRRNRSEAPDEVDAWF